MAKLTVKKIIVLLLAVAASGVWLLPQNVSAVAHDDVTFSNDASIYLAGAGLTLTAVAGSEVASTTINSDNVAFYMMSGSDITLVSNARKLLNNTLGIATVCSTNDSQLRLTSASNQTLVVTPSGDCPSGTSGGGGGGGGGSVVTTDTTAPAVSAVSSQVGSTEAQITWNTNEASLSWVLYGTSSSYGKESLGTAYISSHSVKLTGLAVSTAYHYQVKSKDSTGNIGYTSDYTFTTLATGSLATTTTVAATTTTATTATAAATTTVIQPVSQTATTQLSTKPISQMTKIEIQAEITKIIALIAQLQQELLKMLASSPAVSGTKLTLNLKLGSIGNEVKLLQTWLSRDPAVYPEGKITSYFGALTKTAVIKFQEKYASEILTPNGLIKGTGTVAASTRAKLNSLYGQ